MRGPPCGVARFPLPTVRETAVCGATFHIVTLGCRSNQYDSQRIAEALQAAGLRAAADGEPAQVYVVNTCTVTAVADSKARQLVRRIVREHPAARVFVTGCYATREPEALRRIGGVEGVFGRGEWGQMLHAICGAPPPEGVLEGDFGISGFHGRARALLKIQEGCDFRCAYCVVPLVRGRPRSRPLPHVLEEARRLLDAGFKEIVLTGIHLGLYGADLGEGLELADAVQAVAELPGVGRVRLSSIEPQEVSERLLEAMGHPAVCPHLHLPLQTGDDELLRRMGRRYTAGEFLRVVEAARARLDRPAVGADVIVGLPGESDRAFENTLRVCREAAFSRMHVFRFSPRPGTAAAGMEGAVPAAAVRERCRCLEALARELAERWARSFLGMRERVLFEETRGGRLVGYTDRYVRLSAPGPPGLAGEMAHVRCTACRGAALSGRIESG